MEKRACCVSGQGGCGPVGLGFCKAHPEWSTEGSATSAPRGKRGFGKIRGWKGSACDGPGLPVRGRDRGPARNPQRALLAAKNGEWRRPDRENALLLRSGF